MGGLFGPPLLSNFLVRNLRGSKPGTMKGDGNGSISPLAASRDAAPLQLVLVCTSYEGRSRGSKGYGSACYRPVGWEGS